MNFDCPVAETSESIEPSVNDVELNAIAYSFSNIFEPELKQFSFGDRKLCLRLFSFPLKTNEITEENNTFSAVEDFTLLRWHSGKQKRVERAKQSDQIENEARLLWKSIVKNKTSKPD